ncbi:MAG: hypothetical protein QNJ58_27240 [Desulfobacterales bacterium]|nr:hypothetical protein [Desulfobacterales bacterium]
MNMQLALNRYVNPISLAIVLLLWLGFGDMESHADEAPLSKTTFYVY